MQELFLTTAASPRERYRDWRDFSDERFMPMLHTRTDVDIFDAAAKGADIGPLYITKVSLSAVTLEATSQTVRHHLNKPDVLGFSIKLAGRCAASQYDRTMIQDAGDISIVDANAPFRFTHFEKSEHLVIQIPRKKLEDQLGSARNFVAINMTGGPTSSLVASFFQDLLRVHHAMTVEAANRMASVGADLIVASIAERMAMETPKSLRGTVMVQAAKAYIENNIGNTDLTPSYVAYAAGISLRHLQTLFLDRGQHISAWIWKRRLDVAAERLADTGQSHISVGEIAFACGFSSQSHFSRCFRERYDMRPVDYRYLRNAQVKSL